MSVSPHVDRHFTQDDFAFVVGLNQYLLIWTMLSFHQLGLGQCNFLFETLKWKTSRTIYDSL